MLAAKSVMQIHYERIPKVKHPDYLLYYSFFMGHVLDSGHPQQNLLITEAGAAGHTGIGIARIL